MGQVTCTETIQAGPDQVWAVLADVTRLPQWAYSEGRFPATVAMSRGLTMNMGRTAVLRIGSVDVVVISRHIEPFDPGCFRSLGIEPRSRRFLMLKSRIHYRVGFAPLVRETVECAGVGVCTSDYSQLTFSRVRRPIYPLDGVNTRDPV